MDYYKRKVLTTLKLIELNLDGDLSLGMLSNEAGISKFHFHRIFNLVTGKTTHQVVLNYRIKRAAHQLVYDNKSKVINIALDAGFESPESFTRAFKKLTGKTPTQFKKSPDWSCFNVSVENVLSTENKVMNVNIVNLDTINLSVMRHIGSPSLLPVTLQKFVAWRQKNKLPPNKHRTFNLIYDDPRTTLPEDYRFDIGCETNTKNTYDEVLRLTIPNGRYAKVRHLGAWDLLSQAIDYLYSDWLPQSNEKIADFPIVVERVNLYPNVPESELITDVYLPLL